MNLKSKHTKISLIIIWGFILLYIFYFIISENLSLTQFYNLIFLNLKNYILSLGILGGILYILVYILRPLIFFPATILTLLSGAIFGPYLGFIYTIIGENISANFAFIIARYFKTNSKITNKNFIKDLNKNISNSGFLTTLILRLIWAPFDVVNYSLGFTKIKQKDFFLGTLIGTFPGMLIFILFGNIIGNGFLMSQTQIWLNIFISVFILILSIIVLKYLKNKNKKLLKIEKELESKLKF